MRFSSLSCLFVAFFLVANQECFGQTADRPNFLFIVIDDLNDYQEYMLDGHPQAETPNLNRLARSGVIFQSAYCTTPRSCPSRTSMLSGKDPDYTGVYDNDGIEPVFRDNFLYLARDTVVYTIPEVLRDSGYYTVGINKVYFGWKNEGFDNDFDTLQSDPCLRDLSWSDYIAYAPDQDIADYTDEGVSGFIWSPIVDSVEHLMFDYLAADTAIGILRQYDSDPSVYCNRPLFLTLGIFLPHKPLNIPERYFKPDYLRPLEFLALPFDRPYNDPPTAWPPNGVIMPPQPDPLWDDFYHLPSYAQDMASTGNQHEAFLEWPFTLPVEPVIDPDLDSLSRLFVLQESKRANAVLAYLAAVRFADAQVGRVLDALDSLGIAENTVVVMTSDHGYSLGEKTHWHKFGLWETDNRVPLIVRHPEKARGAQVLSSVSTLDLFPTFLDLASIRHPAFPDGRPYLDGKSLLPFLDQPALIQNRAVLTGLQKPAGLTRCFVQHSVRDEQFHYIRHHGIDAPGPDFCDTARDLFQEELYLIGSLHDRDKNEWNNLANDPRYDGIRRYLGQWVADSALFNTLTPNIDLVHEALPCSYTLLDTLALCYTLTDAAGIPMNALPPNTTVRYYTSQRPEIRHYTNVFRFPLIELMNNANYNADRQLIVYVELVDMAANVILSQDHIAINVNPALLPDISFDAVLQGETLHLSEPVVSREHRVWSYFWDFGDGTQVEGPNPAIHRYTMPGEYTVTGRITFGNDPTNPCEATHSVVVNLPEDSFDQMDCHEPQFLWISEQLCDELEVRWNPVYRAGSYQLRYRDNRNADSVWTYVSTALPLYRIIGLISNRDYAIEVRSYCDTTGGASGVSPWSYPLRVSTAQCFPPRGVRIADVGMYTARVEWLPNPGADLGYRIRYGKLGEAWEERSTEWTWYELTGLDSASRYAFEVLSQCASGSSELTEWGQPVAVHEFTTDSSSLRHHEMPIGKLLIHPNPNDGVFRIHWEAVAEGDILFRLYSAQGNLVSRQAAHQSQGENQILWTQRVEHPGMYWLQLRGPDGVRAAPIHVFP